MQEETYKRGVEEPGGRGEELAICHIKLVHPATLEAKLGDGDCALSRIVISLGNPEAVAAGQGGNQEEDGQQKESPIADLGDHGGNNARCYGHIPDLDRR